MTCPPPHVLPPVSAVFHRLVGPPRSWLGGARPLSSARGACRPSSSAGEKSPSAPNSRWCSPPHRYVARAWRGLDMGAGKEGSFFLNSKFSFQHFFSRGFFCGSFRGAQRGLTLGLTRGFCFFLSQPLFPHSPERCQRRPLHDSFGRFRRSTIALYKLADVAPHERAKKRACNRLATF